MKVRACGLVKGACVRFGDAGLLLSNSGWFNLDYIWIAALVVSGVVLLVL
jgi:hypothetical protein